MRTNDEMAIHLSANQYHSNKYMKLDKVRSALAAIISQGQEETARERSVRLYACDHILS